MAFKPGMKLFKKVKPLKSKKVSLLSSAYGKKGMPPKMLSGMSGGLKLK